MKMVPGTDRRSYSYLIERDGVNGQSVRMFNPSIYLLTLRTFRSITRIYFKHIIIAKQFTVNVKIKIIKIHYAPCTISIAPRRQGLIIIGTSLYVATVLNFTIAANCCATITHINTYKSNTFESV